MTASPQLPATVLTPALTPGLYERSPALTGTAFITLVLLIASAALGAWRPGPVPAVFLHLTGAGAPGWYAGATVGAALDAGGADPRFLVGDPRDGDAVSVFGDYALVSEASAPIGYRATGGRLHLNTATELELEALPRVGPTLAARIRAGRPYRSVDDLDRVKGIGPATIQALRVFVEL